MVRSANHRCYTAVVQHEPHSTNHQHPGSAAAAGTCVHDTCMAHGAALPPGEPRHRNVHGAINGPTPLDPEAPPPCMHAEAVNPLKRPPPPP